jgi:hypothetical protein
MLAISRIGLAGWSSVLLLIVFTVQAEDAVSPAVANGTEIIAVSDNVDSSEAPVDSTSTDVADNTETITASDSAEPRAAIKDAKKYDWAFTGYVAWLSGDQLGDMLLFNAELSNNKVWVVALTKRVKTFYKDVDWEVEGQIGKHGGGDANMDHWELNALTSVRWNRFIWDKYVDTSLATGLGVSYASEEPIFEIEEHGSTNKLLAYILVELAFSPPKYPQWVGVVRIHHRSSAYGLFEEDIQGASNSLGFGIKYRF